MVGDDRARHLPPVGGIELGHALDDWQQAYVVTGHVGHRRGDDLDFADRGEFVHQQQALVLQVRVGLGQFLGIEVDQLAEEQVDDQPALGQLVRLDADVDGHLLLAHVGQQEVVAAGGLVQHRVDPGIERFLEGTQDRGEGLIGLGQHVGERRTCVGAEERPLRQGLEVLLQLGAVTRRQPVDSAQRGRARAARETAAALVVPVLEQIEGEGHERVARLADPEFLVLGTIRIQHRGNAHQVRNPERRVIGHVTERVPAVRAPIFCEGIEQVDLLALAGAPAAGQVEVLLLDVQHHQRFAVLQQVRDDHAHALTRAGRRGQDHELLAVQPHQLAAMAADHDALAGLLEHAVLGQVGAGGETRVAMQRALVLLQQQHQAGHHQYQQRQAEAHVAGPFDLAHEGRDLWLANGVVVLVVRVPGEQLGVQAQEQQGQVAGKHETKQQGRQRDDGDEQILLTGQHPNPP